MNATDELLIELRAIEVGLRAALTALNAALLVLEPGNVVDLDVERAARRPTLTVA